MGGSHYLFDKFGFGKEWLRRPVDQWENCEDYIEMKEFFRNLLVTNDSAERKIKLISEYAMCLTKDSEERQKILQVVEEHQSQYKDVNKKTIREALKTGK